MFDGICFVEGCTSCSIDQHSNPSALPQFSVDIINIISEEIKEAPRGTKIAINIKDE